MTPRGIPISNIPAKTTKEFNKVVCAPYSKRDKIHRPQMICSQPVFLEGPQQTDASFTSNGSCGYRPQVPKQPTI